MIDCIGVPPPPPHSLGQAIWAYPAAAFFACQTLAAARCAASPRLAAVGCRALAFSHALDSARKAASPRVWLKPIRCPRVCSGCVAALKLPDQPLFPELRRSGHERELP